MSRQRAAPTARPAGDEDAARFQEYSQRPRASVAASNPHVAKWTLSEWLGSLKMHHAIAEGLSLQFSVESPEVQIACLKELGKNGGLERVEKLLLDSNVVRVLAEVILRGAQDLETVKAASGEARNDKFQQEVSTFGPSSGNSCTFQAGLEGLLGAPSREVEEGMRREHCEAADSTQDFQTPHYDMITTPKAEWYYVTNPCDGPQQEALKELELNEWPRESRYPDGKVYRCRKPRPLADFCADLEALNVRLNNAGEPSVTMDEVCGLRLYTGPMFMKYNLVLRAFADEASKIKCEALCSGNGYVTTIHAINSGLLKSGKVMKATTVYRGIQASLLPESFWTPDEFNIRGGIEYAFLSTTLDCNAATDSASGGAFGTVLEIETGMVGRGADLSWISQYPHEQEICFAPLTGIEIVSTRVEGAVLIVQVRLNSTPCSLTIEQFLERRKKVISDIVANLTEELKGDLSGPEWQGLADELDCAELPLLAKDVVMEQLKRVTDRPPEAFNDDETMKESLQRALTAVAKARQQRAEFLEIVAERADADDAKRILATAADYQSLEFVVEEVSVSGGPPRGSIENVEGGSALDLLGLRLRGSDLEPSALQTYKSLLDGKTEETLLAAWIGEDNKRLAQGWRLLKVNGKKGDLLGHLDGLYGAGASDQTVLLSFARPMLEGELTALALKILMDVKSDDAEEARAARRRLRRVLGIGHVSALNLAGSDLGERGGVAVATALEKNSSIKSINLSENAIGKTGGLAIATLLEKNLSITCINLSDNEIGEKGGLAIAKALERNSSVSSINLAGNPIGMKGGLAIAAAIEKNSSITSINLADNDILEKGGLAMAKALENSSITSINLSGNEIGEETGLAIGTALEKNFSVASINLSGNAIGEKGGLALAAALEKNSSINAIILSWNYLGENGGEAIGAALGKNSSIKSINLSWDYLGEKGGVAIALALEKNSSINSINLSENELGEAGGLAIARALEKNSSINCMNLAWNAIGDNGGLAVAKALEKNSSITSINLSVNAIGEKGGEAIATALEKNSSITSINLSGNDLGEKGVSAIAKALEKNSSVNAINLSVNAIREKGGLNLAKILEKTLAKNSTVTSMNLSENDLGEKVGLAIAKALQKNFSITSFNLSGNGLGEKADLAIEKALEKNSLATASPQLKTAGTKTLERSSSAAPSRKGTAGPAKGTAAKVGASSPSRRGR